MGFEKGVSGATPAGAAPALKKREPADKVIALAGNPNVGKSTIFNGLTGLRQHTGNWPGKTVACARGYCVHNGHGYTVVDLPGCYSLTARSAEEEVARDFILSAEADAVIAVCDATCLERSLALALQAMEMNPRVVVCVNLMDEAEKKGIYVDLPLLASRLGVPVVGTSARSGGLEKLMASVAVLIDSADEPAPPAISYPVYIERAIYELAPGLESTHGAHGARFAALALLESGDAAPADFLHELNQSLDPRQRLSDDIASAPVFTAEKLCQGAVRRAKGAFERDRAADRVLASRRLGFPIMFAGLLAILWLTITGANYPSEALSGILFSLEPRLFGLLAWVGAPDALAQMLILGVYRTLAWVVSVMLPPMAIFFPLFTLLEDVGYLPRVAFNLDRCFKKCRACGKQALTMCSGNLCCRNPLRSGQIWFTILYIQIICSGGPLCRLIQGEHPATQAGSHTTA